MTFLTNSNNNYLDSKTLPLYEAGFKLVPQINPREYTVVVEDESNDRKNTDNANLQKISKLESSHSIMDAKNGCFSI